MNSKSSVYLFESHSNDCDINPIIIKAKSFHDALKKLKNDNQIEDKLLKIKLWESLNNLEYRYYYKNPQFWMKIEKIEKQRPGEKYYLVTVFNWKRCESEVFMVSAENYDSALSQLIYVIESDYKVPKKLSDWDKENDGYFYYHETKKEDYYVSIQEVRFPKGESIFYHK